MNVVAVIPARFQSRRFPGKALVPIDGVPLVARVARAVAEADVAGRVLVATDHPGIAEAVTKVGIDVHHSTEPYRSGSDRVAAAVEATGCDEQIVLNVQGDEAMIDRAALEAALGALRTGLARDAAVGIGTVAAPLPERAHGDPDVVKVVIDRAQMACHFGRGAPADLAAHTRCLAHVGVYAYTRDALRRYARLPTSAGEARESLEQLRALENGIAIAVGRIARLLWAVNRPADVAHIEAGSPEVSAFEGQSTPIIGSN